MVITNLKYYGLRVLLVYGLWVLVGLLVAMFTFISVLTGAYYLPIWQIILFEQICISPWAVSTPLIIWAARNYRLDQQIKFKSIGAHMIVALLVFAFHSLVQSWTVSWFFNEPLMLSYIETDFLRFLDMRLLLYGGAIIGIYAIDFYRKDRENQYLEPQLKAEINQVKYQALKNQIQPSFLINSIDAILHNLDKDPDLAEQILNDLSNLLRLMLQNLKKTDITIREDVQFFHMYLKILQKRLGTSIKLEKRIDEDCYDMSVPSILTIMPFLEEIIKRQKAPINTFNKLTYIARKTEYGILLQAIISGLKLTPSELQICQHNAKLHRILLRLDEKYEGQYTYRAYPLNDKVIIKLELPILGGKAQNVNPDYSQV